MLKNGRKPNPLHAERVFRSKDDSNLDSTVMSSDLDERETPLDERDRGDDAFITTVDVPSGPIDASAEKREKRR